MMHKGPVALSTVNYLSSYYYDTTLP